MCGILGGVNIEKEKLLGALPLLNHRGPDDQGTYFTDNIGFLHKRLSIQDLLHGQQPYSFGDVSLIFNGEIYNHQYLRKKYNLSCLTNSDAETLVKLYCNSGLGFLHDLDGMFAFAIYDKPNCLLILARDRAGKKPLYYFCRNGKFGFSSELNTIASLDTFGINYNNINQYLRYSFTGSSTPYQDICELEAGSYITLNVKSLKLTKQRWWSILNFYQRPSCLNFNDALDELDDKLNKSVASRLFSSDVEVGAFLSGGIDSGLITAIACRYISKFKTFTVGFEGSYDESLLAKKVSEKYDTDHTTIMVAYNDLKSNVENILSNYGEPFGDSSAIPSFYVSREAKKYLTVALNGDGADELLAGYRRYVPFAYIDIFKSSKILRYISGNLANILPYPKVKQTSYNYLYRLFDLAGKTPLSSYLSSTVDVFEGYENQLTTDNHPFSDLDKYIDFLNGTKISGLQKIMCLDFHYLLPGDLLVKMDIATMANSLEGRSPFLGKDILEFTPSLDDNFKIKGITTKYILRELAKKYLPGIITRQPKRGFEVPLRKWMETDLREMVSDYLSGNPFSGEFINKVFITDLVENRVRIAPEKRAKMLWYMMALEIWYRKCYKKV